MAANFKKAGSVIRNSFRAKRYAIFDAKENNYLLTPEKPKRQERNSPNRNPVRPRHSVSSASSSDENENFPALANVCASVPKQSEQKLKRSTSMTQSVRIAVGTIRQKLKLSTRRGQLRTTPKRAGSRQSTAKGHEVHLYSPFKIDTPKRAGPVKHIHACHTLETPTRLRREVEALTVNMQALSALTPNTLHDRSRTRSQVSTNGRLKSPRSTCKRIL